MTNIDIEEFSSEYEIDYCEFEGEVRLRYYISPSSLDDYQKETRDFLFEFLSKRNIYPIYITLESYNDKEIINVLNKEHISFLIRKPEKNPYSVFLITIEDENKLDFVLYETFHLATQNQFYALSFSDNLHYKRNISIKTMWGKLIEGDIPYINMRDDSTVIIIYHDGLGFSMFSNDKNYSTISELYKHIPEGTFINPKK